MTCDSWQCLCNRAASARPHGGSVDEQSYQQTSLMTEEEEWPHNALFGWQGLCLPDFQDKFPIQWKLVKEQQRRRSVSPCCVSTLDLVRKRNSWAETSATGPTSPKHWITRWWLHEGVAQANGGLADTLVYGNRHRGFDIWALIFFFMMEVEGKKILI